MPGMSGVEFLEEAMRLAPEAKRVLLTAYADTQAAIDAINRVALDHYLMKPWDPPEEQLYPVVDDLLDDWRADAPAGRRRHPHRRPPLVAPSRTTRATSWPATRCPTAGSTSSATTRARLLLAAADGDGDAAARAARPTATVLHGPSKRELAERWACAAGRSCRSTTW